MVSVGKPFKGKSRRAKLRAKHRAVNTGRARKFGYLDSNGKFHTTIRLHAGDNLTEEMLKTAMR